jgi:hypothetical protein
MNSSIPTSLDCMAFHVGHPFTGIQEAWLTQYTFVGART